MEAEFITRGTRSELAIVLHGLQNTPKDLKEAIAAIGDDCPDRDIFAPRLPYGGWRGVFCIVPIEQIVRELVEQIDDLIAKRQSVDGGEYLRITIIGHSLGGVLARKLVIVAHGETAAAPFKSHYTDLARPWAKRIDRIVLLAGISRGWAPEIARTSVVSAQWTIVSWVCAILSSLNIQPTLYAIRVGQPFIVQTRLEWLALKRRKDGTRIQVVQLLGSVDDLVSPDDAVDLAVDSRRDLFLVEVPFTGHANAIAMRRPTEAERAKLEDALAGRFAANGIEKSLADVCKDYDLAAQARFLLLSKAMVNDAEALRPITIDVDDMADTPATAPESDTTDVVFVIHGIRDKGFWTHKIARAIKQEASIKRERTFRSFTGSYGYFAMAPFVLPWIRQWKTGWLMDQYVSMRARYPEARFSYVGHSNGTYLLARALMDYPAAKFESVVFAGSVVRSDYPWKSFLTTPAGQRQVGAVLNYVATEDWVVALLAKAFQFVKYRFDIGGAGFDGFREFELPGRPANLHEARYIVGYHGAGIEETQWDDIARFIVHGTTPTGDSPLNAPPEWSNTQPKILKYLSTKSWVTLVLLALCCAVFVLSFGIIVSRAWIEVAICLVLYLFATRL